MNYLIIQDIIAKQLELDYLESSNIDYKSAIEILNRLFKILEDTLLYKLKDQSDDLVLVRKTAVQLIKNHNQLFIMSLESN